MTVEQLLRDPGHLNHSLLWSLIAPPGQPGPTGRLQLAMAASFGSVEAFQKRFSDVAIGHFASGWTFLVADSKQQTLEILSLPDHQCVVELHEAVLLICDVWEHAYYLKHQNRRAEYLQCWWSVVNWQEAGRRSDRQGSSARRARTG